MPPWLLVCMCHILCFRHAPDTAILLGYGPVLAGTFATLPAAGALVEIEKHLVSRLQSCLLRCSYAFGNRDTV